MLNDYELFLNGCYSAVVKIDKYNDDLYHFIDLMKKLGWYKYAEHLEETDLFHIADINGIKGNICIEYQYGKGFTFSSENEYKKSCEETKILSVKDLIKATNYDKDFCLDYKAINLKQMIGREDLRVLDDFCDMYGWLPMACSKGFNILDTQLDKMVENGCYDNSYDLINRIVGRAIDYYRDETEIDEENIDNAYSLLKVAKDYKNGDKWEEKWLESFEKELEEIKNS